MGDAMNMGVATVPNLQELETEIEGRGLIQKYGWELLNTPDKAACGNEALAFIVALTRLTETQKTQAALKVLNGN